MSSVSKIGSILGKALRSMKNNCRCICIFQCCVSDSEIDDHIHQHSATPTPNREDLFRDYLSHRPEPILDEPLAKYGTCHVPKAIQ